MATRKKTTTRRRSSTATRRNTKTTKANAKKTRRNLLIGGTALVVTGGVSYLGYKALKKLDSKIDSKQFSKTTVQNVIQSKSSDFPLVKGSRGEHVRLLQKALIAIGGDTAAYVIESGGADEKLGDGTASAISSAGYGLPLSKDTYLSIINKAHQSSAQLDQGNAVPNGGQAVQDLWDEWATHVANVKWNHLSEYNQYLDKFPNSTVFNAVDENVVKKYGNNIWGWMDRWAGWYSAPVDMDNLKKKIESISGKSLSGLSGLGVVETKLLQDSSKCVDKGSYFETQNGTLTLLG